MHEEALLRDLVRKVEEVARAHRVERVERVRLWVGALSHLTEGTLRARWSMATIGSVAEGSGLEVESSLDVHDPRAQGVVLQSLTPRSPWKGSGHPPSVRENPPVSPSS